MPKVAAISSVAVVLCAPPLGLSTTMVRGPSRLRCTEATAARRETSTPPGAGEMRPPLIRRIVPCQPCRAGPAGTGGRELRKSARFGGKTSPPCPDRAAGGSYGSAGGPEAEPDDAESDRAESDDAGNARDDVDAPVSLG